MNTVVPIVSTKFFPESCVLSQLAQCINDIPDKSQDTGYSYVAQPSPGYQGYRSASYSSPNSKYGPVYRQLMDM